MEKNQPHNPLLLNTMNIFYSLSFYSPIIICVSIVLFSMFTVTINKALFFFGWVFVITSLRIAVLKASGNDNQRKEIPIICSTGLSEIFIPKEFINVFEIKNIHISGGKYNGDKLDWINKEHIKLLKKDELEK